jgi:tripartite-type tricarboxylate transporter receptor subunit TctC
MTLVKVSLMAALVVPVFSCAPSVAPMADFHGKTVRLIVGVAPGGGYDLYARLMAPHLQRHLPGGPNVVVENMTGAGGLVATNYLAQQGSRDGTTIGFIAVQAIVAQVVRDPAVRFDVRAFHALGSPAPDEAICVTVPGTGLDLASWRQRTDRPPRLGATNYGSTTHAYGALIATALDLPVRFVIGYRGSAEIRAALDSGELEGTCIGIGAYRASYSPKERYPIVVRTEAGNEPDLRDVPAALRLVEDPAKRAALNLLKLLATVSRVYVLPPETPERVRAVIEQAFEQTMSDPAFLKATTDARLMIQPIKARVVERSIADLVDLAPEARNLLIKLAGQSARPE